MGCRPCLPDMLPIVGKARATSGYGSTSATSIMDLRWTSVREIARGDDDGETPFTDPAPYRRTVLGRGTDNQAACRVEISVPPNPAGIK